MIEYPKSPYRIAENDNSFVLSDLPTSLDVDQSKKELKDSLKKEVKELTERHRAMMADGRFSVLAVFQAMDAAGKDSTIRNVFSGLNPSGISVHAFKQPSKKELAHDFMWRANCALPESGRIGVFNRSYYEDVLVVRVHPEYVQQKKLIAVENVEDLWDLRFRAIREQEKHWYHHGTLVIKFFLNVSQEEQHKRFLDRLEKEEKQWKFSAGDLKESESWAQYQAAYQDMLQKTSTDIAPWYVIPADSKPLMRVMVAKIMNECLQNLPLQYPSLDATGEQIEQWKQQLK